MNIKLKQKTWEEVMDLPRPKHKKPKKPNIFWRTLVRFLSQFDMDVVRFKYSFPDKKNLPKGPYLILMNHSSFLDLKLASKVLYPRAYQMVCTADAMMGLEWLMRRIGCIPTAKFVSDMTLLRDMKYSLEKNRASVLMYPEAGYSLDGRSVKLPDNLGSLCKMLKVPVIMIETKGAFLQKPLFAALKKRKVAVTAEVKLLIDRDDIENKTNKELDAILEDAFSFDGFDRQFKEQIKIDEPYRAEGTLLQQHKRRLYAWTSPDGQHRNQIDYILCGQRWRSSIQSAKTAMDRPCGSWTPTSHRRRSSRASTNRTRARASCPTMRSCPP